MIQFKPFAGVRPANNKASLVPIRSVDYYTAEEIDKNLATNPDSFVQVLRSTLLPSDAPLGYKYDLVREAFEDFMSNGTLIQDKKSFYIYQQENTKGLTFEGVLGLVSVDDYLDGKIKKHENTLEAREKTFAHYLSHTHLQAEPTLLTFPENQSIELIFTMTTRNTPSLEFKTEDGLSHKLWQVKDRLVMKQLKDAIEKLPALYIADGHHRMGSASLYTQQMRTQEPDYFGGEDFNFVMCLAVPGNQLAIYDYNRLVKDLNGLSKEEFLTQISETFELIPKDDLYFPTHKHHISMYLDGKFYGLYVKQELRGTPKGLGELDTFLWEEHLMKPILGIQNSRTDDKVQFSKGTGDIHGIVKLKEKVDSGEFEVAFGFYPIAVNDLFLVADEGQTMPPKSTYIEPKLLSGLTIFDQKE